MLTSFHIDYQRIVLQHSLVDNCETRPHPARAQFSAARGECRSDFGQDVKYLELLSLSIFLLVLVYPIPSFKFQLPWRGRIPEKTNIEPKGECLDCPRLFPSSYREGLRSYCFVIWGCFTWERVQLGASRGVTQDWCALPSAAEPPINMGKCRLSYGSRASWLKAISKRRGRVSVLMNYATELVDSLAHPTKAKVGAGVRMAYPGVRKLEPVIYPVWALLGSGA